MGYTIHISLEKGLVWHVTTSKVYHHSLWLSWMWNSTARSSELDVCYVVELRTSNTSRCSCNKEACHVWKKETRFEIWYLALKCFLSNKNLVLFGKRYRELRFNEKYNMKIKSKLHSCFWEIFFSTLWRKSLAQSYPLFCSKFRKL